MIPAMKSTNGTIEPVYDDSGNLEDAVSNIGNNINADYMTYYLGVSIPMDVFNGNGNKNKLASAHRTYKYE